MGFVKIIVNGANGKVLNGGRLVKIGCKDGKVSLMQTIHAVKTLVPGKFILGFKVKDPKSTDKWLIFRAKSYKKEDDKTGYHDESIDAKILQNKDITLIVGESRRMEAQEDDESDDEPKGKRFQKDNGEKPRRSSKPEVHVHFGEVAGKINKKTWAQLFGGDAGMTKAKQPKPPTAPPKSPVAPPKALGRERLADVHQVIFDEMKELMIACYGNPGLMGLCGRSSEETLAQIITRRGTDKRAIMEDIDKWHDGNLEFEEWKTPAPAKPTGPKPLNNKVTLDNVVEIVKTLTEDVVNDKKLDENKINILDELFKLVGSPKLRRKVQYRLENWVIKEAQHFGFNLCWLTSTMGSLTGQPVSALNQATAMMQKGVHPLATYLLKHFTSNLFAVRHENGLADSNIVVEPGNLWLEMERIANWKGEMGSATYHALLATLFMTEIHSHCPWVL